jgi:hypothetical protein
MAIVGDEVMQVQRQSLGQQRLQRDSAAATRNRASEQPQRQLGACACSRARSTPVPVKLLMVAAVIVYNQIGQPM